MSETKGKHLTLSDRAKIEYGINHSHSIRAIAKDIEKSPSSVKREIERNCTVVKNSANNCRYILECSIHHSCGSNDCNVLCRRKCATQCYKWCSNYESTECPKLENAPHVCNGCKSLKLCNYDRHIYYAHDAHDKYREILVERRSGFDLTLGELVDIDNIVSPLIKQGQSPYHICENNTLPVSLSTLYRIVSSGELDATDLDLKEKLRRKPRKTVRHKEKVSRMVQEAKVGHMYEDFLKYMETHDTFFVEMDCVIGKRDESPALLTLHYPGLQMQLAFYLDVHDSAHVVAMLDYLEQLLGYELFCETFPVILTDNGSEFADVKSMERSCIHPKKKRTELFFCEPNRSDEKGSCENNHKLIRTVIPKGTSLVPYTQEDISLMMNHINSYSRKKSFGKCAYDLAMNTFPAEYFDLLGLYKIAPNEVVLKPSLLIRNDSVSIK